MAAETAPCDGPPGFDAETTPSCGEPSVCTVTTACVHEVITTERACPACAAEFGKDAGLWMCVHEELQGRLLAVIITWDEGWQDPEPVTVVQEGSARG